MPRGPADNVLPPQLLPRVHAQHALEFEQRGLPEGHGCGGMSFRLRAGNRAVDPVQMNGLAVLDRGTYRAGTVRASGRPTVRMKNALLRATYRSHPVACLPRAGF